MFAVGVQASYGVRIAEGGLLLFTVFIHASAVELFYFYIFIYVYMSLRMSVFVRRLLKYEYVYHKA